MILLMSAPAVAARQHELVDRVSPRDDGDHDDDPQHLDCLFARGAGEVAIQPQRKCYGTDPYRLPPDLEEQDGQHLSLIHISEPTRLLSISYAVFCLKK